MPIDNNGLEDQPHDNGEKTTAKSKATKRKRSINSQSKDENEPKDGKEQNKKPTESQGFKIKERKFKKVDNTKRQARELRYKDCKHDVSHLFYIKTYAQRKVGHSYIPNYNLNSNGLEQASDLPKYEYPNCGLDNPRPIYYTKSYCDSIDPCFARTTAQEHYKARLSQTRTRYHKYWTANRQLRKLSKEGVYHSMLYIMAERLAKNPDPYFYGNYDFYYTGGNLCTLANDLNQNVLHVKVDAGLNALKLSTFPNEQSVDRFSLDGCYDVNFKTSDEIFEVSPLRSRKAYDMVAARQLNCITLVGINALQKKMKLLIEFESKIAPWISMSQSFEKPEIFVLSTMRQNVRVYDINKPACPVLSNSYKMQEKTEAHIVSSWNRVQRWHGESFLYANESQLFFMDFRAPQCDWLKTECKFSSREYPCEINTSLAKSDFEHLFYVGTTHTVRCMDARRLNRVGFYEQNTVTEWTHQLDFPPAFLDVHRDGTHEYLACASQLVGDLRLCELEANIPLTDFSSHCLPWQPPTLLETYENALLAGKALQPEIGLKQRIRACTTGMSFVKYGNKLRHKGTALMLANSNGDVYAQTLKSREDYDFTTRTNTQSHAIMDNFARELSKLKQPPLQCTDVFDFTEIRNVLLCTTLNKKVIKTEEGEVAETKILDDSVNTLNMKRGKGRWRKSFSVLKDYKDALVPDLLAIWDLPDENECDVKYSTLKTQFEIEKKETNILNWLQKHDPNQPTTTIPASMLNISDFEAQAQSTQIIFSEVDLSALGLSGLLDDSATQNLSRLKTAKPKATKAKKKHVKGF